MLLDLWAFQVVLLLFHVALQLLLSAPHKLLDLREVEASCSQHMGHFAYDNSSSFFQCDPSGTKRLTYQELDQNKGKEKKTGREREPNDLSVSMSTSDVVARVSPQHINNQYKEPNHTSCTITGSTSTTTHKKRVYTLLLVSGEAPKQS